MVTYKQTTTNEGTAYKFEQAAKAAQCILSRKVEGLTIILEATGTIEQIRRLKASTNQVNYSF